MPRIVVESGSLAGRQFALQAVGDPLFVGRGMGSGIHLADAMVSRRHCLVRFSAGHWVLEDQGSRNGTLVNGAGVMAKRLSSGDVIRVGETLLSFFLEEADPLVGKTLAGCRLEKRLGRGGCGTVYLARHVSLDRAVAIKVLAPNLAEDEGFVERFLREARAAARLDHPHVVQVYDAGQAEGLYYITMEYVSGGTLKDLLDREGRLSLVRAVRVALDVTEALSFAESQGLVHRDIKPANLLIDGSGSVKVADLGIVCDLGSRADSSLSLVGSPRYMAPEQVRGDQVDHKADIYALGATLYHALAGVPPFDGKTIPAILSAKLKRDPMPLARRVPQIPAELSAVVQKMMARLPGKRYGDAATLKKALLRAAGNAKIQATAARQTTPSGRKELPKYVKIGGATFLALLVLYLLAWLALSLAG